MFQIIKNKYFARKYKYIQLCNGYGEYFKNLEYKKFVIIFNNYNNLITSDYHITNILHAISWKGYIDYFKLFLIYNVPLYLLNKYNITPLHYVSSNGHHNCIKFLLKNYIENKVNINIRNRYGHTFLINLCIGSQYESDEKSAKMLIKYGIDCNIKNNNDINCNIKNNHINNKILLLIEEYEQNKKNKQIIKYTNKQ